MRERPYGEWLWILNMTVLVVSGVLMSHGMQGVGFWKNIRRVWGELSSHTRFEMGDGSKIHFWHDVWCRAKTLETSFLDLHCLF